MTKNKEKQVFGTLEWAPYNENIITGCSHDCRYCYSKEMAIRFKRKTVKSWRKEEINNKKFDTKVKRYDGKVMFPSSHDITPDNLSKTKEYLNKLLLVGNELLIVSKPHISCIKQICDEFNLYKNRILFRFTIGSGSSKILNFWEPFAPNFNERLKSLEYAYSKGFGTSISIEPMLDTVENTINLVKTLIPFVTDAIWIGKPNFLLRRLKMNGEIDPETFVRAREIDKICSDENMIFLYEKLRSNPKIKWKESIKKTVGIEVPTKKGLDI